MPDCLVAYCIVLFCILSYHSVLYHIALQCGINMESHHIVSHHIVLHYYSLRFIMYCVLISIIHYIYGYTIVCVCARVCVYIMGSDGDSMGQYQLTI